MRGFEARNTDGCHPRTAAQHDVAPSSGKLGIPLRQAACGETPYNTLRQPCWTLSRGCGARMWNHGLRILPSESGVMEAGTYPSLNVSMLATSHKNHNSRPTTTMSTLTWHERTCTHDGRRATHGTETRVDLHGRASLCNAGWRGTTTKALPRSHYTPAPKQEAAQ